MGANTSVHMANSSGQDIFVIAATNPDWAIVDFLTNAGLMLVGVGKIKAVVAASNLPKTFKTIKDIYEYAKIAGRLLSGSISAVTGGSEAALAFIDAVKKNSIPIKAGEFQKVNERGILGMYLSPSGIADLLGARTVSVLVMSGDGKQVANFNTNSDHSWIATRDRRIVRSRYGSIWQQDPGSGSINWDVQR